MSGINGLHMLEDLCSVSLVVHLIQSFVTLYLSSLSFSLHRKCRIHREVAIQKKRLLSYGRDNLKSSIIQEKIIIVNVEVGDAGRILRRTKKEA